MAVKFRSIFSFVLSIILLFSALPAAADLPEEDIQYSFDCNYTSELDEAIHSEWMKNEANRALFSLSLAFDENISEAFALEDTILANILGNISYAGETEDSCLYLFGEFESYLFCIRYDSVLKVANCRFSRKDGGDEEALKNLAEKTCSGNYYENDPSFLTDVCRDFMTPYKNGAVTASDWKDTEDAAR